MRLSERRHGRLYLLVAGSAVYLGLICSLPYRIPFGEIYSISYAYGYNNRVAAVLTACWILFLAALAPRLPRQELHGRPLARSTLHKALAITGLLTLVLYLLTRRLNGLEESIYLIDRAKLLYEGHVPYRDFEFAYGPAFLYGPVLLARLFHVGVADGYGLFWILLGLTGTLLLWQTLRWVEVSSAAQRSVFLLFWAFSVVNLLTFGISYTTFRYVLPCFLALVLYRRLRNDSPQVQTLLWLAPFFAAALAVSPELALGFAVGMTSVLIAFGYLRTKANILAVVVGWAAMAGMLLGAARLGMFRTMMAFSHGANNLPVMPAPHMLLVLLLTGLAACYVGQRVRERRPDAVTVLAAVSACSLTAALGSCDSLHAFLNPFGVMLAGSFVLFGFPRLRRPVWGAMWVVIVGLRLFTLGAEWGLQYQKAAIPALLSLTPARFTPRVRALVLARSSRALGSRAAQTKLRNLEASLRQQDLDLSGVFHLPAGTVFEAPFGFAPGGFGSRHTPAVDEGFFFENENVVTREAVDRKVQEMRAHPERPLLLLPGRENACTVGFPPPHFSIGPPFYYPYMARPVHVLDISEPICAYIRKNYYATAGHEGSFDYQLWLPNRGKSSF